MMGSRNPALTSLLGNAGAADPTRRHLANNHPNQRTNSPLWYRFREWLAVVVALVCSNLQPDRSGAVRMVSGYCHSRIRRLWSASMASMRSNLPVQLFCHSSFLQILRLCR